MSTGAPAEPVLPTRFTPVRRPAEPADGTPVVIGFGGPVTNELPPTGVEALMTKYAWIVDQAVARIPSALLASANLDADDLRQEGMLGLLSAAQSFDRSRSARFTPFARSVVSNAIFGALRSNDPLPESTRRDLKVISAFVEEYEARLGRSPKVEEIASATGIARERVSVVRRQASILTAVQYSGGDNQDGADPTAVLVHEGLEEAALAEEITRALHRLPDRERRIIWQRIVEGKTVRDVAQREKMSIGRVSQIQKKAVEALRALLLSATASIPAGPVILTELPLIAEHVLEI